MSEDQCSRCSTTESDPWFRMPEESPWEKLCRSCHELVRAKLVEIHDALIRLDDDGLEAVLIEALERTKI